MPLEAVVAMCGDRKQVAAVASVPGYWAWASAQCPACSDPDLFSAHHSRTGTFSSSRCGASVPIPVPTQVQNYQRIEQNLQSPTQYQTAR